MSDLLIIGLYLLIFLAFFGWFQQSSRLSQILADLEDRLNAAEGGNSIDLNPIVTILTEKMEDIVEDTLQNLEPPRAIDHVFGAVAQMIQARTMSMMNVVPSIGEAVEGIVDTISTDD